MHQKARKICVLMRRYLFFHNTSRIVCSKVDDKGAKCTLITASFFRFIHLTADYDRITGIVVPNGIFEMP